MEEECFMYVFIKEKKTLIGKKKKKKKKRQEEEGQPTDSSPSSSSSSSSSSSAGRPAGTSLSLQMALFQFLLLFYPIHRYIYHNTLCI